MLKYRILTALILIPITIALLFSLPPYAFCLLTALLVLYGGWEWSNLMGIKNALGRVLYLLLLACFMIGALLVQVPIILIVAFLFWLIALALVSTYPQQNRCWARGYLWRGLMGLVVLISCWAAVNYIRIQIDGIYSLLFLFILIWGADSAAYFGGKKWGRNKLAPQVSPGKSIEGLFSAFGFSIIITLFALWTSGASLSLWPWCLVLGIVTVFFSVIGDLFESMLKREVGLKDSGRLLPGHGGLLDRIDSLTAAAPTFALGALILGKFFAG